MGRGDPDASVRNGVAVARGGQRIGPRRAIAQIACMLALALGCASIEHGYKAQQYAGVPLEPTKGRGAERWPAELQQDETLAKYVAEHGRPHCFYIVDRPKTERCYIGPAR